MKKSFPSILVAVVFAACGSPDAHDHSAGDDHHSADQLEPLAFTVYSDSAELFVEFMPLVVGQESRLAAHLTRTGPLYSAITHGTVSVTLHGNGAPVSVKADAPSVPGIFHLAVTPTEAGACQLLFVLHTDGRIDSLVIHDLVVYPELHEAIHGARPQEPLGDITFLKEQAWRIPYALEQVKRMPFAGSMRVGAEVEPAVTGEQVITARSAGVVHLIGDAALEGRTVTKGTPLFSLSSQGMVGENPGVAMQHARNDFERAKADLERVETLYENKLATQTEVLSARNAFANAEAMLAQTSAAQHITAGMEGYVRTLHAREGQFVGPGDVLATIASNARLSIHADVPLQAFAALGNVHDARIRLPDGTVLTLEELNGKVQSVGRAADGLYVPVRLEVDGRSGLLPGAMVDVWLISAKSMNALTVPLTAVLEQEGRHYCYVQTAGETLDKRTVLLGTNDGLRAAVRSGLNEGDRVVRIGAMDVKLATASGSVPEHGHEH